MQIVSGMIILQASEFSENIELQEFVKNTDYGIKAISLVHEMLYKSKDLSHISIKDYIKELSILILQSFGVYDNRIELNINIDEQSFLLDTAIPLGIIINELMTNSLKYAFPDKRNGIISISLRTEELDKSLFSYADNGVEVCDGFDFRNRNTLGLK